MNDMSEPPRFADPQAEEIGRAVRRGRRQHRALHRRAHRQRPALSRLRHPRHRRDLRVRGDRPPAGARHAAERGRAAPPTRPSCARCAACRRRCRTVLEALPAAAHPMDVMRTGVSALGCVLPEKDDHNHRRRARHRRPADGLASARCCCTGTTASHNGRAIEVETDDDSIGGHFLHLLHGTPPPAEWVRAMHTSLILYAEHEFNASTFACRVVAGTGSGHVLGDHRRHRRAARPEAWRRQRGRRSKSRSATRRPTRPRPTSAAASRRKEVIIGFGHPVYTDRRSAQRGDQGAWRSTLSRGRRRRCSMFDIAERIEAVMADDQADVRRTSTGSAPSPTT